MFDQMKSEWCCFSYIIQTNHDNSYFQIIGNFILYFVNIFKL
jgi:hypothetical protein